jgi:hypothetical protein
MGLEFLLPLIIPIVTPFLTEIVKRGTELLVNQVPRALVPNLSAALGVALAEGLRAGGIDVFPGVDSRQAEDAIAVGLGYGGTGLHQALRTLGVTKTTELATAVKSIAIAILALPLVACSLLQQPPDKTLAGLRENPTMVKACNALPHVKACASALATSTASTDPKLSGDLRSAVSIVGTIEAIGCVAPVPPAPAQ